MLRPDLKTKNGKALLTTEEVLERWQEYVTDTLL